MSRHEPDFQEWVGRSESARDTLSPATAHAMAALLDRDDCAFKPGDGLPPLWQWLYFLNPARQSLLATDGHPRRGGFLPPIPLPRRMWAGSQLTFHKPLRLGQTSARHSRIQQIEFKQGRSGRLAFVQVRHDYFDNAQGSGNPALMEIQGIVFRQAGSAEAAKETGPAETSPIQADFSRQITPHPTLLFRYSALTFNAHRIHYDRDYATGQESYPGLVVHGPLLATLLLELLNDQQPDRTVTAFQFRALAPVFDLQPFSLCGRHDDSANRFDLWVEDAQGRLCLRASAEVAGA